MSPVSLPSSGAGGLMKLLPGYYSGELADGTGMYDLLVDENGETGYVHIFFDDGSAVSGEVDVDFLGDVIFVTSEDGEMMTLRYILQNSLLVLARERKGSKELLALN
jgi:hypothetical protein